MPVLAPLALHNADDVLLAVDIAGAQPDDLAGSKAAAIGQRQHHPHRSDFAALSSCSTSSALSTGGIVTGWRT